MFRVRKAQLAVFSQLARERFARELEAHLWEALPERCAALGDAGVQSAVSRAIERGPRYGLVTEQQVCLLATLMCLMHPGFDEDPALGWAREILSDLHFPYPDRRIEALYDEWQRRHGGPEDDDEAEDDDLEEEEAQP
jgi:hypothetical protein